MLKPNAAEATCFENGITAIMDVNIQDARYNFQKLGIKYRKADNIEIEKEIIQNVTCYWFYKNNSKPHNKVIIYLHGGCYALGSIESHKAMVSHLASETNSAILFVEYSLAPENVFPTAMNGVLKVYSYLANQPKVADLSFLGDSAGPGLIVSAVSALNRSGGDNKLRRCIMISPWVDLRNVSDSITDNKNIDPVLSKESLDFFASLYIGNSTLSEINPIEIVFENFPPTLILVGTNEILLDDSRILYSKIATQHPLTKLSIYEGQTHVWLMDNIESEASKRALEEIKRFLSVNET